MSGCQPTETKCICLCHASGRKFFLPSNPPKECCECNVEFNEISFLKQRIHEIEKNYTQQSIVLSLTNNLSKRICELENDVLKIYRRIEELEKDYLGSSTERIGILGKALHHLSEENHKLRKIPHKCPVCDGETTVKKQVPEYMSMAQGFVLSESCKSCEGKGIVWS